MMPFSDTDVYVRAKACVKRLNCIMLQQDEKIAKALQIAVCRELWRALPASR